MRGIGESTRGALALLFCAVIWGSTFPLIDHALHSVSPLLLNALRFSLAALLLAGWVHLNRRTGLYGAFGWGLLLGGLLALGFGLQNYGMQTISPGRSAFLTASYVLMTPLFEWGVAGRRPSSRLWLGATSAFAGIGIMAAAWTVGAGDALGDALTLASAAAFAAHIVLLEKALRGHGAFAVLYAQIAVCGLVMWPLIGAFETPRFSASAPVIAIIVFLALVATVLVLWLQNYGQQRTSPTAAAVYFATEPLWAALFSAGLGHVLLAHEWIGAGLILVGILIASRDAHDQTIVAV